MDPTEYATKVVEHVGEMTDAVLEATASIQEAATAASAPHVLMRPHVYLAPTGEAWIARYGEVPFSFFAAGATPAEACAAFDRLWVMGEIELPPRPGR